MSKFHTSSVPVVASWTTPDGLTHHLGHPAPLTLDARLDIPNRTASLKLRAIAALKPFPKRTPVYLFIRPDHITTLHELPDAPATEPVKAALTRARKCPAVVSLSFTLDPTALVPVGPTDASAPPLPKTAPSARILDALRAVRGAPVLTLHLARSALPADFLDALTTYLNERRLRQAPGEIESLYNGTGGREMEWPEAERAESPPSYDELGPPPPMPMPSAARKRGQSARASPDREERPRKKADNHDEKTISHSEKTDDVEKANRSVENATDDANIDSEKTNRDNKKITDCGKTNNGVAKPQEKKSTQSQLVQNAGSEWSSGLDQRMTMLSEQLDALKKTMGAADAEPIPAESLSTRLSRLEGHMDALRAEVAEVNTRWKEADIRWKQADTRWKEADTRWKEADTRWKEVAERLCDQADLDELRNQIWEDLDKRLAEERDELKEDAEYRIDERLLATQDDIRKMAQEELDNLEERIKEDLRQGSATVYFDFPRES